MTGAVGTAYPRFRAEAGVESFEPSGVARLPDGTVLVADDAFAPAPLYSYRLEDGALRPSARNAVPVRYGEGLGKKLESLCVLRDGSVLAASTLEPTNDALRRIYRLRPFAEPTTGAPGFAAEPVEYDAAALEQAVRDLTGEVWFGIEGICVSPEEDFVYLGVRSAGADYDHWRATPMLIRAPFREGRIGAPDRVLQLSTQSAIGREEGVSDLHLGPDGQLYILTSYEEVVEDAAGPGAQGGHLFVLPDPFAGPAAPDVLSLDAPLATFAAKSEGVTYAEDSRLLVIFDLDQSRKELVGIPPEESLFTVVEAATP